MAKKIDDNKIIIALMSKNTIAEAAEHAGCSEFEIYDKMKNHSFMQIYNTARAEYLSGALIALRDSVKLAVSMVESILNNEDADDTVRIQAAKFIVNYADGLERRMKEFEDRAAWEADLVKETSEPGDEGFFS